MKSAFENVAAGWIALAEQVEWIDAEKSPVRDQRYLEDDAAALIDD